MAGLERHFMEKCGGRVEERNKISALKFKEFHPNVKIVKNGERVEIMHKNQGGAFGCFDNKD